MRLHFPHTLKTFHENRIIKKYADFIFCENMMKKNSQIFNTESFSSITLLTEILTMKDIRTAKLENPTTPKINIQNRIDTEMK